MMASSSIIQHQSMISQKKSEMGNLPNSINETINCVSKLISELSSYRELHSRLTNLHDLVKRCYDDNKYQSSEFVAVSSTVIEICTGVQTLSKKYAMSKHRS